MTPAGRSLLRRITHHSSLITLLGVVGCGDGRPPAVPAGGKVKLKKSAVPAGALVVFHAADPALEKAVRGKPVGRVGDDGTFALGTYADGDGAPPGEYGVTIDWRKPVKDAKFSLGDAGGGGGGPALRPKYGDPGNPAFKVTVTPGGPNRFEFDVD
jgi:hypothetical protein